MKNIEKRDRLAPDAERGIRPDAFTIQRAQKSPYSQEVEDYEKYADQKGAKPGVDKPRSRAREGK
jgi:hypothetical protein